MPHNSSLSTDAAHASDHFDHLCAAQTFKSILGHSRRLCAALNLAPGRFPEFYPKLKANLQSWKAQGLLSKFDKRASHKCYNRGHACIDTKVLVIGAGPCGLRAAIEAQLLGAKVVVVEKRDRLSRNNVLHLWPMVIHDLKALGAKKFFGKFCAGAIDHISIRQLQCILLKVALLLGVELHENVGFEELVEPSDERTGWRARLSPPDHPAANFQFDVLIGADGKRNTFPCFRRKEFRGKLAIAITANFVNRHTEAEARVDEISGVAFIFNQKFFKDLSAATGIDLENIVYYKDETHYFVMTAKKQSLLAKGVILKDYMDTGQLLSPSNIDRARLMDYAREAADFSTDFQLPQLSFAVNHYGLEDVAMFDFTCMYASCYASTATIRHGHGLLLQLVGDSLLEPFWPTGSGCARGFLSCFDAAWQIRSWANPRLSTLECLAGRESTYRLLAQTTPKNLSSDLSGYSLDPRTRYPNLNLQAVLPLQVRHLVDTDDPESLAAELALSAAALPAGQNELPAHKRPYQPIEAAVLLRWCQRRLHDLEVEVTDLTTSFQSGLALCGLLQSYRPDLLQLSALPEDALSCSRLALRLLETEVAVPAPLTAEELVQGEVEPHALLGFLSRVYDGLHGTPPAAPRTGRITEVVRDDDSSSQRVSPVRPAPDGRHAANGDTLRRQRKRKSEAAHQKTAESPVGSRTNSLDSSASVDPADEPDEPESNSASSSLSWDPVPLNTLLPPPPPPAAVAPLDPQKVALVEAAFRGAGSAGSAGSVASTGSVESAPATPGGGRARLDPGTLGARLADLERSLAAGGEREKCRLLHWERRQLRSLAQRKAALEATLLTSAEAQGQGEFDDFTVHLYRKTAADFASRRSRLEDMVFRPSRMTPEVKKDLNKQAGPELSKKEQFASKVKDLEAKFSGTYQPPDKKPKPVSRVIGRIEKDWNLQQIEKKIEENSRPFVSKDRDYPVPRWNRDAFDDKFQTMQSLSVGDGVPFRRFDGGQRGSNHVSAMAARFGNGHRPAPPVQGTGATTAEFCHFCGQRVYLVERMTAENKFFHPRCFRCEYCSVTLKAGSYAYDGDSGRFFCLPHYGLHSLVKYKYQRNEPAAAVPPCPSPVTEQMRSHLSLRGVTPERAEFENSVCDPMSEEELLSEIDEDEWTDRNFLTTEEVLSGADISDSESCSPDSDEFEPALDEEEVLRLAERWRRLHSQQEQEQEQASDHASDLYESDGVERADDDSDTANHSETEEEASARQRRKEEDGLTEDVLQSRNVRKRNGSSESQTSGSATSSSESSPEEDSSTSTDSESDREATPPALPAAPPPRIVIQDADGLPCPDSGDSGPFGVPGLRPEPIGAERDSSGSGSSGRPSSQERNADVNNKVGSRAKDEEGSPRKQPNRKIGGLSSVLRKPATSLTITNRHAVKPAAPKIQTTARVSVSTLVQPKPSKTTPGAVEHTAGKPTRDIRRHPAALSPYQRPRPPPSQSAAWRHSVELKRQHPGGPAAAAAAGSAPVRSRSAAELGSRVGASTSRVSERQGQQATRGAAAEAARKSAPTRPASVEAARPAAGRGATRSLGAGRTAPGAQRAAVTNSAQRPAAAPTAAARRVSVPERKTSGSAKVTPAPSGAGKVASETGKVASETGKVAPETGKVAPETGKMGKTAPIRRGSGGNRVAAIAARDRVRRQVKENLLKQRLARNAREAAGRPNAKATEGKTNGVSRRRGQGVEPKVPARRTDDAVDRPLAGEVAEHGVSAEELEGVDDRPSVEQEDDMVTSSSSGDRYIDSPNAGRRSPAKHSLSHEWESAGEASGHDMNIREVRLPGPEADDVRMHSSSSEEDDLNSKDVVLKNADADPHHTSPGREDGCTRSLSETRNSRSSDSDEDAMHASPRIDEELHRRNRHSENEANAIRLSLSGGEDAIDDEALEQRWQQMCGDEDLMDVEDELRIEPEVNAKSDESQPSRSLDEYQHSVRTAKDVDHLRAPPVPLDSANSEARLVSDTFRDFDALLDDVDVTSLEQGFEDICDQSSSKEELSSEEESSEHGNVTVTEAIDDGTLDTDEDTEPIRYRVKDTSRDDKDHCSRPVGDADRDVFDEQPNAFRQEDRYDQSRVSRESSSPEHRRSHGRAEDPAWVTADSQTLHARAASESADEDPAWVTAESATSDTRSPPDPVSETTARSATGFVSEESSSASDQELEEPGWASASFHAKEVESSQDLEERAPAWAATARPESDTALHPAEHEPQLRVDERFITFRRRRPASPPARLASPDELELSPTEASPAASPEPDVESSGGHLQLADNSEEGSEASQGSEQRWVDQWREVEEMDHRTAGTQHEEAVPEVTPPVLPAGDEVLVCKAPAVPDAEMEVHSVVAEAVATKNDGYLSVQMVIESRPRKAGETIAAVKSAHDRELISEHEQIAVCSDSWPMKSVVNVAPSGTDFKPIKKPMEPEPMQTTDETEPSPMFLDGTHNILVAQKASPVSTPTVTEPSSGVLPELKLFGGDESAENVASSRRLSDKTDRSKRPSLQERIEAVENIPIAAAPEARKVSVDPKPTSDVGGVTPATTRNASLKSALLVPRGPAATSTPLGASRPTLTALPTPITRVEQTLESRAPADPGLSWSAKLTPGTESEPIWEWEPPSTTRLPPSVPPPPIPEAELKPESAPAKPSSLSLGSLKAAPADSKKLAETKTAVPLPALSAPAAVLAATAVAAAPLASTTGTAPAASHVWSAYVSAPVASTTGTAPAISHVWSAYVAAATPKTRPAEIRMSPLAKKTSAASFTPTPLAAPAAVSTATASAVPVTPTSHNTPATLATPTIPATPTTRSTPSTHTIRTTPVTPTPLIIPITPSTPTTPSNTPITPTTPTIPTTPTSHTVQIRVSPLVEEASARLLRRGTTEPSLILPPRAALSGAPMPLSRLPEDHQSDQQQRPPEESLVRDLVLSRVRRSPEKHLRKRVTSPALMGPSVRPLPPPVPSTDGTGLGGGGGEAQSAVPPPLPAKTRLTPPAPPPPPVQVVDEAAESAQTSVEEASTQPTAANAVSDQTHAIEEVDLPPPAAQKTTESPPPQKTTEYSPPQKTASDPLPDEEAAQPAPLTDKTEHPPPLPEKTRGAARLSLIPAAARALFSPPRRPPRASDQRTPRRKKPSAAERRAVTSMPLPADAEAVLEAVAEAARDRPVSVADQLPAVDLPDGEREGAEVPTAPPAQEQVCDPKTMSPVEPQRVVSPADEQQPRQQSLTSTQALAAAHAELGRLSAERDSAPPEGELQSVQPPSDELQLPGVPSGDAEPAEDRGKLESSAGEVPLSPEAGGQTPNQEPLPAVVEGQASVSGPSSEQTTPARKKEPSNMKKKRERRRSIIQTISDIFRTSPDKKDAATSPGTKKEAATSPGAKKEAAASPGAKKEAVASPPSAVDTTASPSPPAPAAKTTPLRSRLGMRFRRSKDKKLSVSPTISPTALPSVADEPTQAADPTTPPTTRPEPRATPSGRSSPEGTLSRRSRSGRAARHSEIRRQQRAQELQRQLGEVEVRQQELELCGTELEKTIRGEQQDGGGEGELTDDAALMRDWFGLVHERSLLVRRDQLLQLQLQELQLEDRHDRLQLELRERMAAPESQKSGADIERERELVNTLLEISEQRRSLKQAMDAEQDALRAECESAEARQQLLASPLPAPLEESSV